MWTGCSIGDGEEIKGYEDGGPPTLCHPASQQGGGEEDNNLAGGAWGSWRCARALSQIFVNAFKQRVLRGILGSNWSQFLEGSFHQVG